MGLFSRKDDPQKDLAKAIAKRGVRVREQLRECGIRMMAGRQQLTRTRCITGSQRLDQHLAHRSQPRTVVWDRNCSRT